MVPDCASVDDAPPLWAPLPLVGVLAVGVENATGWVISTLMACLYVGCAVRPIPVDIDDGAAD
jgi:hypothetical protein